MEKNKELNEQKPLYDYTISYDISKLPEELRNLIHELEKYDKMGDWLNYDLIFDELEIVGKSYLRHKKISEYDYKILLRKYGWLYD